MGIRGRVLVQAIRGSVIGGAVRQVSGESQPTLPRSASEVAAEVATGTTRQTGVGSPNRCEGLREDRPRREIAILAHDDRAPNREIGKRGAERRELAAQLLEVEVRRGKVQHVPGWEIRAERRRVAVRGTGSNG